MMNRSSLLFAVLACVAAASFAQQSVGSVFVCDEASGCAHQFVNGAKFKILTDDGLTVSVSLSGNSKYFRADVSVLNSSRVNVDVLPSNFILQETEPHPKPLQYVDAGKILRSIERRAAWGNALTAMGAGMQRQQTTTTTSSTGTVYATGSGGSSATGTYNGSAISTTSAPDYAAQARANRVIRARNAQVAALNDQLSRTALRANTVIPNQSVRGFVFFKGEKKAKTVVLSIPVGAAVYKFPFTIIHR